MRDVCNFGFFRKGCVFVLFLFAIAPVWQIVADPVTPVGTPEIYLAQAETSGAATQEHHAAIPAFWSVIPFVVILLCVALMPVFLERWWHNNYNKLLVSLILGLPVATYLIAIGRFHDLEHQLVLDYIPFIMLLGALFYISGGIVLRGDIQGVPLINTMFLAVGSVLASFIGTTGASMVLIRPLMRSNAKRKFVVHTVVFFIFVVSNIGGLLTPLGDPPLFLGYLKGVPFVWTFRLLPQWAFTLSILLVMYYIWDVRAFAKEEPEDRAAASKTGGDPLALQGRRNILLLVGVVLVVAFVNENYEPFKSLVAQNVFWKLLQSALLFALILISGYITPKEYREANHFTLHPIQEVAFLFLGIFMTMIPALILLGTYGGQLGVTEAWQYFVATGLFSSFLDNAPTYLVFLSMAQGQNSIQYVLDEIPNILAAISLGAVFMGANTYIGNAPNFMVKSIAEENRIAMPSFGKYMVYSFGILSPVFLLVIWIFL